MRIRTRAGGDQRPSTTASTASPAGSAPTCTSKPRRPDGPRDRWRWLVTPRWRRAHDGRLLPYDNQANTAQKKLATVQLVLAALLAAPNPRGRVLVLDELGDSLGISHRREVLREIADTAQAKGVTVLGTCQDSVLADAAAFCGELSTSTTRAPPRR